MTKSRTRRKLVGVLGVLSVLAMSASTASASATAPQTSTLKAPVDRYDHVFLIVEENHGPEDVIGNPAAPNLNHLADHYGLATSYYGITHPSEPNYVAMLGGSTFGVANDNPYYLNRVNQPSLVSQLDHAGLSWKAYLQGLPHPGYQGICYPAFCNGVPDKDPLYVSKHNPVVNFTTTWNSADRKRQVPAGQLGADLSSGHVPAFGIIIPDECHDQHGDPPYCLDSGALGDSQDKRLVATGDQYLGRIVSQITRAPFWSHGNNAVVVTYDEGNGTAGTGSANPGGGKVATVVVTSHGPRHFKDATPYNHYSLLKTLQQDFGLACLAHSCDADVSTMAPLLTVTGAPATATSIAGIPSYPTPTPTPQEPVTFTTEHASNSGWTVQPAPRRGTGDNGLGAVSASGPRDIWAVGNYLPDTLSSNPDATLSLAAHYDGSHWTSTPTPNSGPNFNTLFGVAALPGQAWAVGDALDARFHPRSLIEHWNGKIWKIAASPILAGEGDMLFSVSANSAHDVWAVGQHQSTDGRFAALVEHFDGHKWTVVPVPNPGVSGNSLYSVSAASARDVWAVGQRNESSSDRPLIEHFDGLHWSTVATTPSSATNGLLDAVTASHGQVWAAGQTDDATHRSRPLIGHLNGRNLTLQTLDSVGSDFSNLNGIAVDRSGTAWATGAAFDPSGTYNGAPGGVQQTLLLRHDPKRWQQVAAPSPGTADRVLGGITETSNQLITVGYFKDPSGRQPLIESHDLR